MTRLVPLLAFVLLGLPVPVSSVQDVSDDNPFSAFETHFLSNGMKVWFKNMPDAPNVAVSIVVPVGQDQDPMGMEEMAHFLEHMQFSDHMGRTTEEIKKEVDDRGGEWNGFTATDRTFYFVHVGQEHWEFALDWMYHLISPHAMESDV